MRAGVGKAFRNIHGIGHTLSEDEREHFLLLICRAGTMSILPRHRTNILPRCHRRTTSGSKWWLICFLKEIRLPGGMESFLKLATIFRQSVSPPAMIFEASGCLLPVLSK